MIKKFGIHIISLQMICLSCTLSQTCFAQATPFKKSVLDSLTANEFNASFAYSINLGQDGTSTLTTNADLGLLYSTQRSDYELNATSYFDRFEKTSTSNRFFSMLRVSM